MNIGDTISWETISGKYLGIVEEIDNEVLYVRMPDGSLKTTEWYYEE